MEEPAGSLSDKIMKFFIAKEIYTAVLESSVAEQIARVLAMENATDNAQQLIEELVLVMNRERQRIITQEISDIVGGIE